jgi:hypothetical protein
MAEPWKKYQQPTEQAGEAGPWSRYQAPVTPAPAAQEAAQAGQAQPQSRGFGQGMFAQQGGMETGLASGLSFGLADELFAAGMTPIEMAKGAFTGEDEGKGFIDRVTGGYSRALDRNRATNAEARERQPMAALAGDVLGATVTGGQLARGGATLLSGASPTYGSMIGRGAAEGALYGAAHGFGGGEGVEDRLRGAGLGAGIGAVTGGAVGAVGARGAQRAAERTVPTTDALKAQANALYKQADQAGVVVSPRSFSTAVDDIAAAVQSTGIDRTIHPKATAALQRLLDAKGQPLKLQEIDTLRRVVGAAAKSIDPDERRIASIMINKVDDYLMGLQPTDVLAGNSKAATSALTQARDLWSRFRKGEVIGDLVERAGTRGANFTGSGQENALRAEFRTLSRNAKKMRGFTAAEQQAIRKVAQGGPVENAMRALGKFAPTGVVSTGLSGGMGYAIGGPVGSAALMGAGMAGRKAATAMTSRNAQLAELLTRSGGQIPKAAQLTGPQRAMIEALTSGGAVAPTSMSR